MDEGIRERLARNEAAFRKVNEAIESGRAPDELVSFICECGALGCNALIELTVAEYEEVREHPRRFFVVHGHEEPEVEFVVARHDRFTVVEKREEESDLVEATDPRG